MTTTFVLIRHGSHDLLGRVLASRMPGIHLNGRGRAETARLAARLSRYEVHAVVAGPLERAQETAAPLAARLGRSVVTEPGFDEVAYGAWTGLPFDTLRGEPEWRSFQERRATSRSPGGESLDDVRVRAVRALDQLAAAYGEACIVVVSHGDVIKTVVADALGLPLDSVHRFDVDPASRTVVVRGEWGAKLVALNVPPGRATAARHGPVRRGASDARGRAEERASGGAAPVARRHDGGAS
jgi:broad specificity phosphatase PhoE